MLPFVTILLVWCHLSSVVVEPHTSNHSYASNTTMATHTSHQIEIIKWPSESHPSRHNGIAAVIAGQRPQHLTQWYNEGMAGLIMVHILNHNGLQHLHSDGNLRSGIGWEDISYSQRLLPVTLQPRVHPWCIHCRSTLPQGRSPEGTSAA